MAGICQGPEHRQRRLLRGGDATTAKVRLRVTKAAGLPRHFRVWVVLEPGGIAGPMAEWCRGRLQIDSGQRRIVMVVELIAARPMQ